MYLVTVWTRSVRGLWSGQKYGINGYMSGVIGLSIAVLLIVAIGLSVIGSSALRRHPREQWGARVKTASHMVMDGVGLPRVDGHVPVREVDFDEMWATNVREGNAYYEIPSAQPLENFVGKIDGHLKNRKEDKADITSMPVAETSSDATSSEETIRPSVKTRFRKATSIVVWKDRHEGPKDQVDSERTVA